MKTISYLTCLVAAVILAACGKEDDNHSTDLYSIDNYFLVPEDAMDTESILRREFYQSTGVHLLFNDTLRMIDRGTDRYGSAQQFVQLLDPGYSFTAHTGTYYRFNYVPESNMQGVADFLETDILGQLNRQLFPYSILAAERIDSYTADYYDTSYALADSDIQFYKGFRCMLISVRNLDQMSPEERAARAREVIVSVAAAGVGALDENLFTDFFKWAEGYYGGYSWSGNGEMYNLGFLGHDDYYGFTQWYTKSKDISSYVETMLTITGDEFMALYGDYPACVAKYNFMKGILEGLGFTL